MTLYNFPGPPCMHCACVVLKCVDLLHPSVIGGKLKDQARKMTQPHHHVFNALQQVIIKSVKIEAILGSLVEKKVITASDASRYKDKPKNGMKILISYLRNRSFETFLDFVECIFLAQGEAPSKVQSVPVVESMIIAVQDFDQRNNTTHTERLVAIQEKYLKQKEEVVEEAEHTVEQPTAPSESETTGEQQDKDLALHLEKLSLVCKWYLNKQKKWLLIYSMHGIYLDVSSDIGYARLGLHPGARASILPVQWGRVFRSQGSIWALHHRPTTGSPQRTEDKPESWPVLLWAILHL